MRRALLGRHGGSVLPFVMLSFRIRKYARWKPGYNISHRLTDRLSSTTFSSPSSIVLICLLGTLNLGMDQTLFLLPWDYVTRSLSFLVCFLKIYRDSHYIRNLTILPSYRPPTPDLVLYPLPLRPFAVAKITRPIHGCTHSFMSVMNA